MKHSPELDGQTLFVVGFFFEIGLVFVAAIIAGLVEGQPFPFFVRYDVDGFLWGLTATLPLIVAAFLLTSTLGRRLAFAERIYRHVKSIMGNGIRGLRTEEIILLAAAAGVGEEVLFRGVLQEYLTIWPTSLLFGVLHALTPSYFILATLMSAYLGWLQNETGNLLVPILVHWLYDCVALLLLRRQLRRDFASEESSLATDPGPP